MLQDLRFALRMLRKSPSTTAVAVLTLAVAIGGTTGIFSVVSAMLLRPLPFPRASELIALQDVEPGFGGIHGFSWPEVEDVRSQAPDLRGLAAYTELSKNLTGIAEPRRIRVGYVSRGFFEVLGTPPVLGRSFVAEEHVENAPPVAIASPEFWHRTLSEMQPGSTVTLDGVPFQLVGVAPPAPSTVMPVDLWIPLERELPWRDRGTHYLETVARLKPGVPFAQARADLKAAMPRIAEVAKALHLASMQPLQEFLHGSAAPLLLLLLAAVGLVLLIAAVNLASLVLSRATGRMREFAVRRALGATGGRLARHLLVENAVVGIAGGSLGLLLALWSRDLILRFWPPSLPPVDGAPLDFRVLAFAALVSLGAGIGIGVVPALQAAHGDLSAGLKDGSGATSRGRARAILVIAQSGLAVLLLIGAVLVLRSFSQMLRVSPGFHAEDAIALRIGLPAGAYPGPERRARFFREVLDRVATLPEVRAAGAASRVPLDRGSTNGNFTVVGRPPLEEKDEPFAEKRVVTSGYFAVMQIPLVAGRAFTDSERGRVVVINQALARRIFPGEDPVGRRIRTGMFPGVRIDDDDEGATIVGVAANVKQHRLNEEPTSEIYAPQAQVGAPEMDLIVRTTASLASVVGAIKAQVLAVDPDQPITAVRRLEQVIERSASPQRLAASLLSIFAGAALLLAALGIYGMVSHGVSRREREIGVRMALGARAADVVRMVLREGLRLSLYGIAAGAVAALVLGKLLASFLYGVSAKDPATFALVAAGLAVVAVAASWIPARRATHVDPAVALRSE